MKESSQASPMIPSSQTVHRRDQNIFIREENECEVRKKNVSRRGDGKVSRTRAASQRSAGYKLEVRQTGLANKKHDKGREERERGASDMLLWVRTVPSVIFFENMSIK